MEEASRFVAVDLDWYVDDLLLPTADAGKMHARLRLAIGRRRREVDGEIQIGELTLHPASYSASMIALIESPQVGSLKFLTCERRSV